MSTGATDAVQSVVAAPDDVVEGVALGDGDGLADGFAVGEADGLALGDADGLLELVGDALGEGEAAMTTVAAKASATTAATPANLRMVLSFRSCPRPVRGLVVAHHPVRPLKAR